MPGGGSYALATGAARGRAHRRALPPDRGAAGRLAAARRSPSATARCWIRRRRRNACIEVVGDSISCGYGILGTLDDDDCYGDREPLGRLSVGDGARARRRGQHHRRARAAASSVNYRGDTVDTMPQIYERTLASDAAPTWDFRVQPQAVVINLGTNDLGNGKGDPGPRFATVYRSLVETIRSHYPRAFILCTIGPLTSIVRIGDHLRPHPHRGAGAHRRRRHARSRSSTGSRRRPRTSTPAPITPTSPRTRSWRRSWPTSCARASAGDGTPRSFRFP